MYRAVASMESNMCCIICVENRTHLLPSGSLPLVGVREETKGCKMCQKNKAVKRLGKAGWGYFKEGVLPAVGAHGRGQSWAGLGASDVGRSGRRAGLSREEGAAAGQSV